MFEVGSYIVYKNDVCKVKEIKENHFAGRDYYILVPLDDASLKIDVPVENRMNVLREILSKEEAYRLISSIPEIPMIDAQDRMLENHYRSLLKTGRKEDLIPIIKTAYNRNQKRIENGKKTAEKDEFYFAKAEHALYQELSLSLDMTEKDVREYVIHTLTEWENAK